MRLLKTRTRLLSRTHTPRPPLESTTQFATTLPSDDDLTEMPSLIALATVKLSITTNGRLEMRKPTSCPVASINTSPGGSPVRCPVRSAMNRTSSRRRPLPRGVMFPSA
jgi:hypothetical protein